MRMRRPSKRSEAVGLAILALFGLIMLTLCFIPTPKGHSNWGFGPNWVCTPQGIDVSCQRK
jgi:hypothetical protein